MQRFVPPPRAHFLHGDISGKRTTRTLRELRGEEPKESEILEYIHDITFSLLFLFSFTISFSFGSWLLDCVNEWMPAKYSIV